MKEKTINTEKRISIAENAAPALLSSAVISAASYIYSCGSGTVALFFALVSSLYSVVLFALYERLRIRKKTWLTVLSVVVTMVAVNSLATWIIRDPTQVGLWFMEPSRFTRVYYDYSLAFILVFGFILISCLYYFTRVRYRGVFVFLICLCPFCLFAKTFTAIPVLFPVIIMTLFFFLMISSTAGEGTLSEKKYAAAFPFIFVITAIAAFFPKLDFAPFREQFDEFVTGVSIGTEAIANITDFSDTSSNVTSRDEDTVVYHFYGDNPNLVKRQCFNVYDIETNTWSYYGNSNDGYADISQYLWLEDTPELYEAAGFEPEGVDKGEAEKSCIAKSESRPLHALLSCQNMTDIRLFRNDSPVYRTELDEYFLSREAAEKADTFVLSWNEAGVDTRFEELFTDEFAQQLAEESPEAYSYMLTKQQAVKYNEYLLRSDTLDKCYSSREARERVRSLAEEITADCTSDYMKAVAIESFFLSGEYIYDKNFTAPNPAPDYFIFNYKRGACASYATAATLMCRELGLTARYCEGLRVQKRDTQGAWFSTSGDSHAFVQVWVNGYGWTDIDPTSFTEDGGYFDPTFIFVGLIAAAGAIIVVLVTLLRPKVREAMFVRRINKERGAKQASDIYRKINALLNTTLGNKHNTFTPTETADKCAELLGYDISGFVAYYENAVYGGRDDNSTDCSAVYSEFVKRRSEFLKQTRKRKSER